MKFSLSFSLLALVTPAVAIDGSVRADSKLGKRILGKARQLENNNYAY